MGRAGQGELPLTDILGALPATFDGGLMADADGPDITDSFDSAVASASWMRATFG